MLQKCLTRTVDEECYEMLEQLVEQMKENQGVTEYATVTQFPKKLNNELNRCGCVNIVCPSR